MATYEGSGEEGGFTPQELRSAYQLPETGGSGQTVVIVDAYNDPKAASDLEVYRDHYGLKPCTEATGCFKKIDPNGETEAEATEHGKTFPEASPSWGNETSLDVDMVSAVCQECHIVLVEAFSAGPSGLGAAEEEAASLKPAAISNSWFFGTDASVGSEEAAYDQRYFDHPGTPILVAGGDAGYEPGYPATSPYVIAVGGTRLRHALGNPRGWAEEAWSKTGSGCSRYEPKPPWQMDPACPNRIANDVAAVASPESPVSTYNSYEAKGWRLGGGTSTATPIVAGIEALSTAYARELGAEAFYRDPGGLFDVTEGSNGFCTPPEEDAYFCTAGVGYDGPTGNGTPDGPLELTDVSTVSNVQPNAGPLAGGTRVSITGSNLEHVSAVKFGSNNSTSFRVNSETSITAVAPPGTGTADVTVTSPSGVSATTSADKFSWRKAVSLAVGADYDGQLGDGLAGSKNDSNVPVEVKGLNEEPTATAAGPNHSLALVSSGKVFAWGENKCGQLGNGTATNSDEPVEAQLNGQAATAIAGGGTFGCGFSLAVLKNGQVMAWGEDGLGQLGDGKTENSSVPVPVCAVGVTAEECAKEHKYLEHVAAISAGEFFSLAVLEDGEVVAWGNNGSGQLGNGSTTASTVPMGVCGMAEAGGCAGHLSEVASVAAGASYSLALMRNGTVRAWGLDRNGQLGDGTSTEEPVELPVAAKELDGVTTIAAHFATSTALRSNGSVMAWGENGAGQFGNGSTTGSDTPLEIEGLSEVSAIAAGQQFSLNMLRSGRVVGAGEDSYGQLGNGRSVARTPMRVEASGLDDATAIAAGAHHSLAIADLFPTVTNVQPAAGPAGGGTTVTITGTHFTGAGFAGPLTVKFGSIPAASVRVNSGSSITAVSPPGPGTPPGTGIADVTVTTPEGTTATGAADKFSWRESSVLAWGDNQRGQLGNGTTTDSDLAVEAQRPSAASAIAAGWHHSLAIVRGGTVMAWGANYYGQLGDGLTGERTNSDLPVQVKGLSEPATAVAAGPNHSLALLKSGKVFAWGENDCGQLGDGKTGTEARSSDEPVEVHLPEHAKAIAAGGTFECGFSLALLEHGKVFAWGNDQFGQLGDGATTNSPVPVEVQLSEAATAIGAGENHGLAVLEHGNVEAWGDNASEQLGDGMTNTSDVPVPVCAKGAAGPCPAGPYLEEVKAVAGGESYSLALLKSGNVVAWGANGNGQLGDGNDEPTNVPVEATELSGVTAVAAYSATSVALRENGAVMAWGSNEAGQFGNGSTTGSNKPLQVLSEASAIAEGEHFSLDELQNGKLVGAGEDGYGQLGDDTKTNSDVLVEAHELNEPTMLAGGEEHSLALLRNGTVASWGLNASGQLGNGTTNNSDVPVPVCAKGAAGSCSEGPYLTEVKAVAGGGHFSLALLEHGRVMAWGANEVGQLGDGGTTNSDVPVEVQLGEEATAIAAGENFGLAVLKSGKVSAWGDNASGQLGNGTSGGYSDMPVSVSGGGLGEEAIAVAAGGNFSLALLKGGAVKAWGGNQDGQLGNGTETESSPVPVPVKGLSNVTAISAGRYFGLGLRSDGTARAWGENQYGQLGNGTLSSHDEPVEVKGLGEVTAVATGRYFSLAQSKGGATMAWGDNEFGQLGDGKTGSEQAESEEPVEAHNSGYATAIAGGAQHALAIGLRSYSLQLTFSSQLEQPFGLAVSANGHVFVSDYSESRVLRFSGQGSYEVQFGSAGTGSCQYEDPTGIAIDSHGDVWVVDQGNDRLEEFSAGGQCIRQVGSTGSGPGQFKNPLAIAIDSRGDLWVSDTGNERVERFSSEGIYESQIGGELSNGGGEFAGPAGVAVDAHGHVWVADVGHGRIVELSESGQYLGQIGQTTSSGCESLLCRPEGVAVDGAGHIWVADTGHSRADEFDEAGELIGQLGQMVSPISLAVDPNLNVWVADNGDGRVEKWTPSG
jgi:alpha-tubulin suppressor-like RCC1 family protein/sugar lactone lactonase YvrE